MTATAISSTSILVNWSAPIITNGNIRYYYIVFYSTKLGISEKMTELVSSGMSTQLINLMKSTNYTIFVRAFTVAFSAPSDSVSERTHDNGIIKN